MEHVDISRTCIVDAALVYNIWDDNLTMVHVLLVGSEPSIHLSCLISYA